MREYMCTHRCASLVPVAAQEVLHVFLCMFVCVYESLIFVSVAAQSVSHVFLC
jgi:hypothetical protein